MQRLLGGAVTAEPGARADQVERPGGRGRHQGRGQPRVRSRVRVQGQHELAAGRLESLLQSPLLADPAGRQRRAADDPAPARAATAAVSSADSSSTTSTSPVPGSARAARTQSVIRAASSRAGMITETMVPAGSSAPARSGGRIDRPRASRVSTTAAAAACPRVSRPGRPGATGPRGPGPSGPRPGAVLGDHVGDDPRADHDQRQPAARVDRSADRYSPRTGPGCQAAGTGPGGRGAAPRKSIPASRRSAARSRRVSASR